jgi:hypothetical protein
MTATRHRPPPHPCPGCSTPVRAAMYACGGCWRRLPGNLRTAILRAWGRRLAGTGGAAAEHDAARAAGAAWYAHHPREENHR